MMEIQREDYKLINACEKNKKDRSHYAHPAPSSFFSLLFGLKKYFSMEKTTKGREDKKNIG